MATILLSAAGAAIGGAVGGSVLGVSSVALGRFAGAAIGRSIDQRLLGQGSETVETGRVNRLRLTGSGEGEAISQLYGRMRVGGQVIWATEFREEVTVKRGSGGGGKGSPKPATPKVREISYSVSLALALCEARSPASHGSGRTARRSRPTASTCGSIPGPAIRRPTRSSRPWRARAPRPPIAARPMW